MEEIGKLDAHQYYQDAIELMTPLSFITSKEIDPTTMPTVPNDPKSFEEYFLRVCSIRLSLVLAKETPLYATPLVFFKYHHHNYD